MGIPGMQWDDVEIGIHNCEIVDAELGTSSTGNPTLVVRMLVDGQISDMTVFSLLPQAMFKVRSFLRVLGFSKENDPDPSDLIGLDFEGVYAEDDRGSIRLTDWRVSAESDDDDDDDDEEETPAPVAKPKPKAKPSAASRGKARDFE